jgi:pSer/pThr/pTyr-binding forkhead associated (FHA) protein
MQVSDPTASKQHFKISWDEVEGYILEDLDSQHGTRINGLATERQVITEFDRIAIGDTVIVFEPHDS